MLSLFAAAAPSLTLNSASTRRCAPPRCTAASDESALLDLLASDSNRGKALGAEQVAEVHRLAASLEAAFDTPGPDGGMPDTNYDPLLPGRWRVLYQGKPNTDTPFFSLESWQAYLSGDGPSPIQNLVSGSGSVGRLYQIVELDVNGDDGRILNVVDASPTAVVAIDAALEGRLQPRRLGFRFTGGQVLLRALWKGTLALPYPVPFELLGDNAKGWLQTDYLSPNLRLSRGNKGSLFVFAPEPDPDDPELESYLSPPPPPAATPPAATLTKEPVLVCPAQFGTADDYADLTAALEARGHPTAVAPLDRFSWFRLLPASLTPDYWMGNLQPEAALPFYFEALDAGVAQLAAAHPGKKVQLVAHSIGGWIARAWLAQLDDDARAQVSALVTLGTPHAEPPEDGPWRTLDQTRGLLANVNSRCPGAYHEGIRYASVGSSAVQGQLRGGGLDGLLGFASYLPLCGDGEAVGDGITPQKAAHPDGWERRDLDGAYHIAFVPFLGARLRGTPWYGSEENIEQWVDVLK